jgi:hypothetical protein
MCACHRHEAACSIICTPQHPFRFPSPLTVESWCEMDTNALVSLMISALSLVVSLVSAAVAIIAVRTSARIAMRTADLQLHNFADELCKTNPSLYEFHGITMSDVEREGVSPEELTYLVHSFDAAYAYHSMQNSSKVEISEYRRNMLLHPKVRKIWKLFIVGKTLNRGPFTKAVDDYIEQIERGERQSPA